MAMVPTKFGISFTTKLMNQVMYGINYFILQSWLAFSFSRISFTRDSACCTLFLICHLTLSLSFRACVCVCIYIMYVCLYVCISERDSW